MWLLSNMNQNVLKVKLHPNQCIVQAKTYGDTRFSFGNINLLGRKKTYRCPGDQLNNHHVLKVQKVSLRLTC